MRRACVVLACLALVTGPALAQPARNAADAKTAQDARPARVALVIGNAAYKDAPLANSLNDARDVAKALEGTGFKVILRENASLKQMQLAIREFGDLLGRTSSGVFYFAGHGVQVRGRNYLLPVDADIAREDEVAFSAMDLAAVLEKMDTARNPLNLVILDACRNNPFSTKFQLSAPGLAQIDAPAGTLIAFSTAPGSVASDGSGRNGLYTQHLLREMVKPGAAVEEVFKAVRAAVRKDSAGKQVPWESTSLESRFAFVEAPKAVLASAKPAGPSSGTPGGSAPPRSVPTSVGAPPAFAKGDRWRYRVRNLLNGTERAFQLKVTDIVGDEVRYDNGNVTDVVGNPVKGRSADRPSAYSPAALLFVFPLKVGSQWAFNFVQDTDGRVYDVEGTVRVTAEEDVATPAGTIRALRLERDARWVERGKDNRGLNQMTYWYSSVAKRPVVSETRNTSSKGKLFVNERVELESYDLR